MVWTVRVVILAKKVQNKRETQNCTNLCGVQSKKVSFGWKTIKIVVLFYSSENFSLLRYLEVSESWNSCHVVFFVVDETSDLWPLYSIRPLFRARSTTDRWWTRQGFSDRSFFTAHHTGITWLTQSFHSARSFWTLAWTEGPKQNRKWEHSKEIGVFLLKRGNSKNAIYAVYVTASNKFLY